ncbi:MAG TPA: hypothetical protein VGN13_09475 [Solirubrobacteraceae bacterium]
MSALRRVEYRPGVSHRREETLRAALRRQVPVLVIAEPDQGLKPAIEAGAETFELDGGADREEGSGRRQTSVNVFEDLPIVVADDIDAETTSLLARALRHAALNHRVGAIGAKEVADPGEPEQARSRRHFRARLAISDKEAHGEIAADGEADAVEVGELLGLPS